MIQPSCHADEPHAEVNVCDDGDIDVKYCGGGMCYEFIDDELITRKATSQATKYGGKLSRSCGA